MYEDFRNRLVKRYKHLSKWAKRRQIYAWRLYHNDIPEYPFIIDIYEKALHFQVYDNEKRVGEEFERFIDDCARIALDVCALDDDMLFCKIRSPQKGRSQYEKIDGKETMLVVREGDCKFLLNLNTYLDTGLFLDHRRLRGRIQELSKNKDVLNLFAYTGSFSVYAAKGGARSTETVDLSKTYLQWARKNFELNHIDLNSHRFMQEDVFAYLERAKRGERRFDLIVLDPPTFSNSKKMQGILDIRRDGAALIESCYELLKDGGLLFFSTNRRQFRLDAEVLTKFNGREITHETTDEDFKNAAAHKAWVFSSKG
ncbi:MAG: class I SAM-dependent methyltransferase [Bradymonadales bacterium]|jgi:23S rRNA (cytosine1962-C5)-methyltransferase